MSALDEHLHAPWKPGGTQATPARRARRRSQDLPNWRIVRYCDDFVVLVHRTEDDVTALREEIAGVLSTLRLCLWQAKTRVVPTSEGFDFLGFRIQWRRKRGTNKWHVYTFIGDRPIRSLKAKIRAATSRTSQDPGVVLIRLEQIMRGWSNYFRRAVAKHTFGRLAHFVWWRVARRLRRLHRWGWKDFRRPFFHTSGYLHGILCCLVSGATLVTATRYDSARLARLVSDPGPAVYHGQLLPEVGTKRSGDALRAWCAGSGGQLRCAETPSGARLCSIYGMSESSGCVSISAADDAPELRHATNGAPLDGVEVRIADAGSGDPVDVGVSGQILVRGPNLMLGYFRDRRSSAETLDARGWLRTGDLGHLRADGSLVWKGRLKDILSVGG